MLAATVQTERPLPCAGYIAIRTDKREFLIDENGLKAMRCGRCGRVWRSDKVENDNVTRYRIASPKEEQSE